MKLDKSILGHKRDDYLSWDEFFIGIAKLSAARSKDPNTQVGACIVSSDNRILSIGYNGAPNNFEDDIFPWNRSGKSENETKYPYVCHAELNAVLNYPGAKSELNGATLYIELFPCNECAKVIIQSGIKEIVYLSDKYANTPRNDASKYLFDTCKVKYRQIDKKYQKTFKLSLKPNAKVEEL